MCLLHTAVPIATQHNEIGGYSACQLKGRFRSLSKAPIRYFRAGFGALAPKEELDVGHILARCQLCIAHGCNEHITSANEQGQGVDDHVSRRRL